MDDFMLPDEISDSDDDESVDVADVPPAKRLKLEDVVEDEEATKWWETKLPRLELTQEGRDTIMGRKEFWLNKLSDPGLAALEVRKGEINGNSTMMLYESASAKDPGLSLHHVMGLVKNPRLDGLGVLPDGAQDNGRKFKMVLVPFYTAANQAIYEHLGGDRAQWVQNLQNQLPGSREMCADEWTQRILALVTRVAELAWDFKAEDGKAIPERLALEKRLHGKTYDAGMKKTKFAEGRQDFIDDFVACASERQWEPTTGDLYLKAPVFVDAKYKGVAAHKDSSKFVFENSGKFTSDISPEQQASLYENICGGNPPRVHLKPIKFFSRELRNREAPYGKGERPGTVNLCDAPVQGNDCVLVSISVTLNISREGKAQIIFKLRGGTVNIWQRGPGTSAIEMFAV